MITYVGLRWCEVYKKTMHAEHTNSWEYETKCEKKCGLVWRRTSSDGSCCTLTSLRLHSIWLRSGYLQLSIPSNTTFTRGGSCSRKRFRLQGKGWRCPPLVRRAGPLRHKLRWNGHEQIGKQSVTNVLADKKDFSCRHPNEAIKARTVEDKDPLSTHACRALPGRTT